MQDVQIELIAKHLVEGAWEETAHHYNGKCVEKGNGWYLTYKEEMEGAGEVSTTLKLTESAITLIRQGGVSTRQEFRKGLSTHSSYQSPYGPFAMETHTSRLRVRFDGGLPAQIEIVYQLWMNGQYTGEHELKIKVSP